MMRVVSLAAIALALFGILLLAGCGSKEADQETEKPAADVVADVAQEKPGGGHLPNIEEMKKLAELLDIDLADKVEDETGLAWIVRAEGDGPVPEKGQTIEAHYTGYLMDGTKFDSSVDRGQPFSVAIGVGRVISGWDMAFTSMKVGEKRVLFIPSDLAYGPGGRRPIPPNAPLVFDVELLGIVE